MSIKAPTYKELKSILTKKMSFERKTIGKKKGTTHESYEGYYKGLRRVVTLDKNHDNSPPKIQKQNVSSIIKQIGIDKKTFLSYF